VVVFKFGCTADPSDSTDQLKFQDYVESQPLESFPRREFPCYSAHVNDSPCFSYRKVLRLGPHGANIPSIDFSSNEKGQADCIVAIDINGMLWIFQILGSEMVMRVGSMHKVPTHRLNIDTNHRYVLHRSLSLSDGTEAKRIT